LFSAIALLGFGVIMVYSASAPTGYYNYGGKSFYFGNRQLLWAFVGTCAMLFFSKFNYKILRAWASKILILALVMLILVLIIGVEVKGGKRWLGIGALRFQPSEFAKLAIIIFLAERLSHKRAKMEQFKRDFLPNLIILGLVCGLIILEKHLSGTVVVMLVGLVMLYTAGAKTSWYIAIGMAGIVLVIAAIVFEPYRMDRIVAFLDPMAHKQDEGWQVVQSLFAIASGGIFGMGLGQGRQKFLYVSEPQNDFIFSIICEELGFIGAIFTILLFVILIWRGVKIAIEADDFFASMVATGITSMIAIQVVLNIAVVTSSIPTTGMPLPFFSYGGSSILFLMSGIGIMLNISSQSKKRISF